MSLHDVENPAPTDIDVSSTDVEDSSSDDCNDYRHEALPTIQYTIRWLTRDEAKSHFLVQSAACEICFEEWLAKAESKARIHHGSLKRRCIEQRRAKPVVWFRFRYTKVCGMSSFITPMPPGQKRYF